jgi:hypothetical protein
VLTFNDVKDDLKGITRKKPNEKFGFPTDLLEGGMGIDFAIVTPTDEQAFDYGFTGETFPYRDMAKKRNAVVIVPDIRISITEVSSENSSNAFKASIKLNILPVAKLDAAMIYALPPDLSGGTIQIQTHGKRLAGENVGVVKKVSEDNNTAVGWSRTVGDFTFTVNPQALAESILRVAYSINDLTVKTIKDAH